MGKKKQRKMKETAEEHGFDKKKKLLLLLLLLLLTFEMFWLFLRDNCSSRDKRKARTQNPQRTQTLL
jgi:zona occludens toxin (predicted ATPase)